MRTLQPSLIPLNKLLTSPKANKMSVLVLIAGLLFFVFWLANYSWTIIATPYPVEYREGAILLETDSLLRGMNPFSLANHPLMNNVYGFLYNAAVLPFAMVFGNTLAVHRLISLVCIWASCALVAWILFKTGAGLPFAISGGGLVLASLLFQVTPSARPDALGELLFLLTILLPWYRKFDAQALLMSGLAGILAFFAKPYFLLSVGIVAAYVFFFVSKKKGLFYILSVAGTLLLVLYVINIYFECYFLDVVINNMANSVLSDSHLLGQLILFAEIFLPGILILLLAAMDNSAQSKSSGLFGKRQLLNITSLDQPLLHFPMDYFVFFLGCTVVVIVVLLGRHVGAYMAYLFQLITPGLILVIFHRKDILHEKAVITVPLILINFALICFWVLYPNQLSPSQQKEWDKLYRYVAGSTHILNSPVLVPEMIRMGVTPVDSGQTELYFNTKPYGPNPFVPDHQRVSQQGREYLQSIRTRIQSQGYDYIIVTSAQAPNDKSGFVMSEQSLSPFASQQLIDQFYEQVELINIAMPQSGQYWIVEVNKPRSP